MTDEQKDKNIARFLIVDIAQGTILADAPSEDAARTEALSYADDGDDENQVIGVFQKIGTARIERKAIWKGVS